MQQAESEQVELSKIAIKLGKEMEADQILPMEGYVEDLFRSVKGGQEKVAIESLETKTADFVNEAIKNLFAR